MKVECVGKKTARRILCEMVSTPIPSQAEERVARASLRSLSLDGPVGRLEAILNEGDPDAPFAAAVCHPHPAGGGTMHNKVVYHAMKAFNSPAFGLQWPVLRFNFRGTGLSEGRHDGLAESGDVLAALDWLEREYKRPIIVAGFSFGAAMALHACCASRSKLTAQVRAIAALGLPTRTAERTYQYHFLSDCSLPKLFLSGDRDQFASVADLQHVAATTAEPKKLALVPGADHFFSSQLEAMQNELASWLKEIPT
jgi:alpha/beta superfamily hydrolase